MRHTSLTALCLAVAAFAAAAQEEAPSLTTDDARNFVDQITEQSRTAVAEGNWQGIISWFEQHIADDAPVALRGDLLLSSGPAMEYAITMKGADLTQTARMAIGSPASLIRSVEDYSLDTVVQGAWQVPGGKVSVAVSFYESGAIDLSEGEGAGTDAISGPFSSEATCALRLGGSADDVTIEMAACEVHSMF